MPNMVHYVVDGNFARDVIARMKQVTSGELDTGEYEQKFAGFTRLANAAAQLRYWCKEAVAGAPEQGELVATLGNVIRVLDAIEADARKWAGQTQGTALVPLSLGKLKRNTKQAMKHLTPGWTRKVKAALNQHQDSLIDAGKAMWPTLAPDHVEEGEDEEARSEEGTSGEEGRTEEPKTETAPKSSKESTLAKNALAEAKRKATLQAQLIVRELGASSQGPAYMEKKEGQYSKLAGFARQYESAANQAMTFDFDAIIDYNLARDLVSHADDWVKRATKTGLVRRSTRMELKGDVIHTLTELLTVHGVKVPEIGEPPETDERGEGEGTEEGGGHEVRPEAPRPEGGQRAPTTEDGIRVARGRVVTHGRVIQEALHKADKLGGPAYLEKKQGLYTRLVELATEWRDAARGSYETWAIQDEQRAERLIGKAKEWLATATLSGLTAKKEDRRQLRADIARVLGAYLDIVIPEDETEQDDRTAELRTKLGDHITFIMKQLEFGTIGPAFMETRWHAYSKLQDLCREVLEKTEDWVVRDTLTTLMDHASRWAKLQTEEKENTSHARDALRQEVILTLGGIKL